MSSLNQLFADVSGRFTALSLRERWLVLGAIWALLAWLGLLLYEGGIEARVAELRQSQESLTTQLAQQQLMSSELSQGLAALNNNGAEQQLDRLNQRLSRLNENVDERMQTLVEPEEMSALLLSMLRQSKGLDLLELSNEAPTRLNSEEDSQALYRHNLSLVLSGSFLSLLDYVQLLEQLSGRVFWRGLEFELEEYPTGTIRLDFFTISQHKELLRG